MSAGTDHQHIADTARVVDALHAIPPDLGRDEWVKVGMAAKEAGVSFEAFDQWSAGGGNYDARACRDTWRSIKPGKGIGPGTLFKMAVEHGYRADHSGAMRNTPPRSPTPARPPAKPKAPSYRPGMSPAEVWGRCQPATHQHPYIQAKGAAGVPLDGLRVVPDGDPLTVAGTLMAGALVVPAYAPDGKLQSLQLIPPHERGKKLNLPGAPMTGALFTVGTTEPGGMVYVCEGIGAAWACWQATGRAAVACFGWSNVGTVAKALRASDGAASIVLVPDVGKEDGARKIAAEVGARVALLPDGEENNFDVNDYAQREGGDALAVLLEQAEAPPKPEPHPLARFLDLDGRVRPPRWIIPGFIGHGVVTIAGARGAGKTSALLPLAMVAAGLHASHDPLAPRQWRHVVYITEDFDQAMRIISGIVNHGGLGITMGRVKERMHLVDAVRLDPQVVALAGKEYLAQFVRTVHTLAGAVEVLPLVVLDTKASILDLESENDNAEASRAMAALKQGFGGLPVWLIGHVAKQNMSRADVGELTLRGASAFEGDANQVLFLAKDVDGSRWLVRGKTRFEAKWLELQIHAATAEATATDEFGNVEPVTLLWGIPQPPIAPRKEQAEQAKEQAAKDAAAEMREAIRRAVQVAMQEGNPLSKRGIRSKVSGKAETIATVTDSLITEGWLYEVFVQAKERAHPKKDFFIVSLTTEQKEAYRATGLVPPELLTIPQSWKKQPTSLVPKE